MESVNIIRDKDTAHNLLLRRIKDKLLYISGVNTAIPNFYVLDLDPSLNLLAKITNTKSKGIKLIEELLPIMTNKELKQLEKSIDFKMKRDERSHKINTKLKKYEIKYG